MFFHSQQAINEQLTTGVHKTHHTHKKSIFFLEILARKKSMQRLVLLFVSFFPAAHMVLKNQAPLSVKSGIG